MNNMSTRAVYTILSQNYLGQALSLRESFLSLHCDTDFYIVLIDKKNSEHVRDIDPSYCIWAEELPIKNYLAHSFKFDVIEWSTNVKPFAAQYLLKKYEKILYLDPDLYFYHNIDWIFSTLSDHALVVTPHATTPIYDEHSQGDLEWMRVGTFNLGFFGVRRCEESEMLLTWWGDRCLSDGYSETSSGIFVDQKWLTLAVGFFPTIKILFEKGLNVATWNFHERRLSQSSPTPTLTDGSLLYFFHFSGFDYENPVGFNKRQTRWPAGSRIDFESLALNYRTMLEKYNFKERIKLPYSGDFFDDGTYITPMARKVYACLYEKFNDVNPYSIDSNFYKFSLKIGLTDKNLTQQKKLTAGDLTKFTGKIKIIDKCLFIIFKVLGPIKYFNFMRYLSHISSIRNQNGVFKT